MKTITLNLTDEEYYMLESNTVALGKIVSKGVYTHFTHEDYLKKSIEDTYMLLKIEKSKGAYRGM